MGFRSPGTRSERAKNLVTLLLILGLGTALVIFFTAPSPATDPLGLGINDSKGALREMEVIGGKANLMAAQFQAWVGSLFQGRTLAFTIAFLTLALAGALWFWTAPLPPEPPPEA